MDPNSQQFVAVQTIFGTGYVLDPRSEPSNLPTDAEPWLADVVKSVGLLLWGEARQTRH
jgi:hypothetical protein